MPCTKVRCATRKSAMTGSMNMTEASLPVTVNAPTDGNTLVAVISTRSTTANAVSSISQSGATWSRVASTTGIAGVTTEIWYAPNVSGAGTMVTININVLNASGIFSSAVVAEYIKEIDGVERIRETHKYSTPYGTRENHEDL